MRHELETTLRAKYPELFAGHRDWPPDRQFVFAVEDGWYGIIDAVLTIAQWQARQNGRPFTLSECKEKIGTLRIRFQGIVDERLLGATDAAEEISARTCEGCGNPGRRRDHRRVVTLCDACASREAGNAPEPG